MLLTVAATLNKPSNNIILEVVDGPKGVELRSYVVECGETRVFGSGSKQPIGSVTCILHDRGISGRHFRISNDGRKIRIEDLESKNGTKINGSKITDQWIEDGTMFRAGNTSFRVRWEKRSDHSNEVESPIDSEPSATIDKVPGDNLSNDDSGYRSPIRWSSYVIPDTPPIPDLPPPAPPTEKASESIKRQTVSNGTTESNESIFGTQGEIPNGIGKYRVVPPDEIEGIVPPDEIEGIISPIVEDDIDTSFSDIEESGQIDRTPGSERSFDPVARLMRPSARLGEDFRETIALIASRFEFYAIAHLAKIPGFPKASVQAIPLFPHIDPNGTALPVAIPHKDWMLQLQDRYAARLAALDGLLLVVSSHASPNVALEVVSMGVKAVPGFSEDDGFVPWCWPSGANSVAEALSDSGIATWLGPSFDAIVFPRADKTLAYVRPEQLSKWLAIGFS